MKNVDIPVWEKYTLTIEEASAYFRIGEKKLRRLVDEHRNASWLITNGNRIQIKRKQSEKIIDELEEIGCGDYTPIMIYSFCHIGALSRYERSDLVSLKRRDNRNRILRGGESQRKDGRYMYKYIDNAGNAKYVYSWKLVKTDTVPQSAKNDISLRDKEKQIHKDLEDDIVSLGGGMTVLELVKKYISQKTGVRHNTEANYNFVINIIKKEAFGNKRIDKVKLSDAKGWLIKLQADGIQYHTYCKGCGKTCVSDGS